MNFEKRLIQLVRENDVLYNYYHPDYKKLPLRIAVWTEVANQLNIDVREVQKRWQNLRRVYRRIRIKMRQTGRLPRSKWRHFDAMEFIREFDPTPGEQNIMDIRREGSKMEQNDDDEEMFPDLKDEIKFEDYDDLSSLFEPTDNCTDHQLQDVSEILHSIVIEHVPEEGTQPREITSDSFDTQQEEYEAKPVIVFENVTNFHTPPKARKKPSKKLKATCSKNLSILGAKIDAITVPQRLKFELERKVSDLVYEVLNKYSADV